MLNRSQALRSLPAVHRMLAMPEAHDRLGAYPLSAATQAIAAALDELRSCWGDGKTPDDAWWQEHATPEAILSRAHALCDLRFNPNLRPVLNLTGVVIHTNLGRAPLSKRALAAVERAAAGYSNLEYDLASGQRGSRHSHAEERICRLTGAEAALVVNNNAAAVFLVLRELAQGGEAVVSRGQLVEIGGSFRIPDIMRESGVDLVEVGTTNRTKLRDYEQAITERTKLILRVHTSNFRILGFTEDPDLAQLTILAHGYNLPVYEDLGSGSLFDYAGHQVGDEPTVRHSVDAEVDVISFSGDKLLGGAQAGIIIGRKKYIERLKKNPLARALRVDKMTLAALEATLIAYEDEQIAMEEIPVVRMLTQSQTRLRQRASRLLDELAELSDTQTVFQFELQDEVSRIGGGALPLETLPTCVIAIHSQFVSAQRLFDDLRLLPEVPIVGRIENDRVLLDMRTLLEGEERVLVQGLARVASAYLARS